VLGIRDRGMIREGFWADMAILNLEQLQEKSTFLHPHQYAEGIEYVLVNGQFVVDAGKLTWALPGAVITRPAIH
jgi:N-acyl-D-aspartate/D-glutamate deacylase